MHSTQGCAGGRRLVADWRTSRSASYGFVDHKVILRWNINFYLHCAAASAAPRRYLHVNYEYDVMISADTSATSRHNKRRVLCPE